MLEHEDIDVTAKLKEYSCPYLAGAPAATIWLEGYQAGYNHASNDAVEKLEKLMKTSRNG